MISTESLTPRILWARRALVASAALLCAGLLGQTLTAGLAVFVSPGWWARHREVVHWFEWLTPLALLLAFLGRAPRAVKGLAGLTIALLFLQYTTAGLRASGRLGLAALHAVNAVLLFWCAAELARQAWRATRHPTTPPSP
jgi:hypothetical protein